MEGAWSDFYFFLPCRFRRERKGYLFEGYGSKTRWEMRTRRVGQVKSVWGTGVSEECEELFFSPIRLAPGARQPRRGVRSRPALRWGIRRRE